jgi:hypothetical protein
MEGGFRVEHPHHGNPVYIFLFFYRGSTSPVTVDDERLMYNQDKEVIINETTR